MLKLSMAFTLVMITPEKKLETFDYNSEQYSVLVFFNQLHIA